MTTRTPATWKRRIAQLFGPLCGIAIAVGVAMLTGHLLAIILIGVGAGGWGAMLGTIAENSIKMEARSRKGDDRG